MSVLSRKLLLPGCIGSHDCVVRTADGGKFVVHRGWLCARSPFFEAAFCVEYGSRREVLLTEVSASVLGVLLDYYYEDKLNINNDNVVDVVKAADMLLMDEVRDLGLDHMVQNMDTDNCLDLAALTQWHHWPKFRETVFSYLCEHFDEVWRNSSRFPKTSTALLAEVFSSDELNVREEPDVLYAARRWYTQNRSRKKERVDGLYDLLECARVGICKESALIEFRKRYPALAKTSAYQAAVCDALRGGVCVCKPHPLWMLHQGGVDLEVCKKLASELRRRGEAQSSGSASSRSPKSSSAAAPAPFPCMSCHCSNPERWVPRVPHEMLFMVGGWGSEGCRHVVEVYDPRANRWLMHTKYNATPRAYHGVVLVGKHVYVVGGKQGSAYLRSCERFDTKRCVWEPCSPMHIGRSYVAVAALDNYVYAIGGRGEFGRTASVERYDPVSNQWTEVSPMKRVRSDASACTFRGKVYVSGGFDGHLLVSSVEEFTPFSNSWCLVQQMPSPRCSHHMVAMAGRIYIVGGYNGHCRLNTMIASDEDETPSSWQEMAPMSVGRSTFAVAQLYGDLYVIGGFNGICPTDMVECYSPATNTWRPAAPLNEPVSAMAACYVKGIALARRLATRGALGLSE